MSREIEKKYIASFASAQRIPTGVREEVIKESVATVPFIVGKLPKEATRVVYLWRSF